MRFGQKIGVRHTIAIYIDGKPTGKTVERRIHTCQIGNFNPLFCWYGRKVQLVQTQDGDISDPFRVTAEMFDKLYIDADKPCEHKRIPT